MEIETVYLILATAAVNEGGQMRLRIRPFFIPGVSGEDAVQTLVAKRPDMVEWNLDPRLVPDWVQVNKCNPSYRAVANQEEEGLY